MPSLARHLQDALIRDCPAGWACQPEVSVVTPEMERLLGYAPQADVMLQEKWTGRRVWVELEISRADPVANHAKFAPPVPADVSGGRLRVDGQPPCGSGPQQPCRACSVSAPITTPVRPPPAKATIETTA